MTKKIFIAGTLLAAVGVLAFAAYVYVLFPRLPGPGDGSPREFEIEKGIGPKGLAAVLSAAGITDQRRVFAIWLRFSGQLQFVKAGRFRLKDDATPKEVIRELTTPEIDRGIKITIPEGYNLRQIGEALELYGVASKADFLAAARESALVSRLDMPKSGAEGYLFPDTYFFNKGTTPQAIIEKMHANFEAQIAALGAVPKDELRKIVTLASIVQAEARLKEEMPLIAGVYVNRLTKPEFPSRLLQADPTVSYGCEPYISPRAPSCEQFLGTLTRAQLDDEKNSYNTYRRPGLPPGPICSPGIDALIAAAKPAQTPHFYFVVSSPGRHAFSATLKEHERAVEKYRSQSDDHGEEETKTH